MLELNKVCKTYGSEPAVHALVDVDLALERGEWLSITGPSGAGKSTLLNVIGCLDHPTSGTFLFDGIDTAKLSDGQRAGLRSQRIGFVFQSFHLLPYRTVLENVMLAEVYRQSVQRRPRRRARGSPRARRAQPSRRISCPASSRAANSSASQSLGHSWVRRACCCATSRREISDSKTSANLLDLLENLNDEG